MQSSARCKERKKDRVWDLDAVAKHDNKASNSAIWDNAAEIRVKLAGSDRMLP